MILATHRRTDTAWYYLHVESESVDYIDAEGEVVVIRGREGVEMERC